MRQAVQEQEGGVLPHLASPGDLLLDNVGSSQALSVLVQQPAYQVRLPNQPLQILPGTQLPVSCCSTAQAPCSSQSPAGSHQPGGTSKPLVLHKKTCPVQFCLEEGLGREEYQV